MTGFWDESFAVTFVAAVAKLFNFFLTYSLLFSPKAPGLIKEDCNVGIFNSFMQAHIEAHTNNTLKFSWKRVKLTYLEMYYFKNQTVARGRGSTERAQRDLYKKRPRDNIQQYSSSKLC